MKKNINYFKWLGITLLSIGVLSACTQDGESNTKVTLNETETKTEEKKTEETKKYLYENDAFQIEEVNVKDDGHVATVRGKAKVHEANVLYSVEDGHKILEEGFTTASIAAPEWGTFEFTVQIKEEKTPDNNIYLIVLYEEDMKDGSKKHELTIPVELLKKE